MHDTKSGLVLRQQKHAGVTWVDLENPDQDMLVQLEHDYGLHPVHLQESTQKVQHTQVEVEQQYLFFVLHYPVFHKATGKLTVRQVGIFLGEDYVVTIRSGAGTVFTHTFGLCVEDSARALQLFKPGAAYLLYALLDNLLDDISLMTDGVLSELDEIEDLVFDNDISDAQRIARIRQKIVKLCRIIGPKRLILQDLTDQVGPFAGQNFTKYYSNNAKKVDRLWEVISEAKETVEIFKDADFTTSTEQTNQILAVLTILFTCSIPITIVGSLYGMNVLIPGGIVTGSWTFFGRYTTFGMVVVVSLLLGLAMYVYFKRKKWF